MSKLRELRKKAKLSQQQLADKSGVPQPSIVRFEKPKGDNEWRPITRGAAGKLATALGCTPQELLPPIEGSIDELLVDVDPEIREAIRQLAVAAAKR